MKTGGDIIRRSRRDFGGAWVSLALLVVAACGGGGGERAPQQSAVVDVHSLQSGEIPAGQFEMLTLSTLAGRG